MLLSVIVYCRVQLTLVVVDGAKRIDQRVAENLAALFEHALRCKHEIVIVINKVKDCNIFSRYFMQIHCTQILKTMILCCLHSVDVCNCL
jgi:hypothetical protein